MWFLKSKKALQIELLGVLYKGRKILRGFLTDYGGLLGDYGKNTINGLMEQIIELDVDIRENYENFTKKQLHLFIKMFKLLLKAKRYEVALMTSV